MLSLVDEDCFSDVKKGPQHSTPKKPGSKAYHESHQGEPYNNYQRKQYSDSKPCTQYAGETFINLSTISAIEGSFNAATTPQQKRNELTVLKRKIAPGFVSSHVQDQATNHPYRTEQSHEANMLVCQGGNMRPMRYQDGGGSEERFDAEHLSCPQLASECSEWEMSSDSEHSECRQIMKSIMKPSGAELPAIEDTQQWRGSDHLIATDGTKCFQLPDGSITGHNLCNHSSGTQNGESDVSMAEIKKNSTALIEQDIINKQRREIHLLMDELGTRDRELNDLVKSHQSQVKAWEKDRQRINQLQAALTQYEEDLKNSDSQLKKTLAEMTRVCEQKEIESSELQKSKVEMERLMSKIEENSRFIEELEIQNQSLNDSVKELLANKKEMEERERKLLAIIKKKDDQLSSTQTEKLLKEIKGLKTIIAEWEVKHANLLSEVDSWQKKYHFARKESSGLTAQLKIKEESIAKTSQQLHESLQQAIALQKALFTSCEREKCKEEVLFSLRKQQKRTMQELMTLREIYERQNEDLPKYHLRVQDKKANEAQSDCTPKEYGKDDNGKTDANMKYRKNCIQLVKTHEGFLVKEIIKPSKASGDWNHKEEEQVEEQKVEEESSAAELSTSERKPDRNSSHSEETSQKSKNSVSWKNCRVLSPSKCPTSDNLLKARSEANKLAESSRKVKSVTSVRQSSTFPVRRKDHRRQEKVTEQEGHSQPGEKPNSESKAHNETSGVFESSSDISNLWSAIDKFEEDLTPADSDGMCQELKRDVMHFCVRNIPVQQLRHVPNADTPRNSLPSSIDPEYIRSINDVKRAASPSSQADDEATPTATPQQYSELRRSRSGSPRVRTRSSLTKGRAIMPQKFLKSSSASPKRKKQAPPSRKDVSPRKVKTSHESQEPVVSKTVPLIDIWNDVPALRLTNANEEINITRTADNLDRSKDCQVISTELGKGEEPSTQVKEIAKSSENKHKPNQKIVARGSGAGDEKQLPSRKHKRPSCTQHEKTCVPTVDNAAASSDPQKQPVLEKTFVPTVDKEAASPVQQKQPALYNTFVPTVDKAATSSSPQKRPALHNTFVPTTDKAATSSSPQKRPALHNTFVPTTDKAATILSPQKRHTFVPTVDKAATILSPQKRHTFVPTVDKVAISPVQQNRPALDKNIVREKKAELAKLTSFSPVEIKAPAMLPVRADISDSSSCYNTAWASTPVESSKFEDRRMFSPQSKSSHEKSSELFKKNLMDEARYEDASHIPVKASIAISCAQRTLSHPDYKTTNRKASRDRRFCTPTPIPPAVFLSNSQDVLYADGRTCETWGGHSPDNGAITLGGSSHKTQNHIRGEKGKSERNRAAHSKRESKDPFLVTNDFPSSHKTRQGKQTKLPHEDNKVSERHHVSKTTEQSVETVKKWVVTQEKEHFVDNDRHSIPAQSTVICEDFLSTSIEDSCCEHENMALGGRTDHYKEKDSKTARSAVMHENYLSTSFEDECCKHEHTALGGRTDHFKEKDSKRAQSAEMRDNYLSTSVEDGYFKHEHNLLGGTDHNKEKNSKSAHSTAVGGNYLPTSSKDACCKHEHNSLGGNTNRYKGKDSKPAQSTAKGENNLPMSSNDACCKHEHMLMGVRTDHYKEHFKEKDSKPAQSTATGENNLLMSTNDACCKHEHMPMGVRTDHYKEHFKEKDSKPAQSIAVHDNYLSSFEDVCYKHDHMPLGGRNDRYKEKDSKPAQSSEMRENYLSTCVEDSHEHMAQGGMPDQYNEKDMNTENSSGTGVKLRPEARPFTSIRAPSLYKQLSKIHYCEKTKRYEWSLPGSAPGLPENLGHVIVKDCCINNTPSSSIQTNGRSTYSTSTKGELIHSGQDLHLNIYEHLRNNCSANSWGNSRGIRTNDLNNNSSHKDRHEVAHNEISHPNIIESDAVTAHADFASSHNTDQWSDSNRDSLHGLNSNENNSLDNHQSQQHRRQSEPLDHCKINYPSNREASSLCGEMVGQDLISHIPPTNPHDIVNDLDVSITFDEKAAAKSSVPFQTGQIKHDDSIVKKLNFSSTLDDLEDSTFHEGFTDIRPTRNSQNEEVNTGDSDSSECWPSDPKPELNNDNTPQNKSSSTYQVQQKCYQFSKPSWVSSFENNLDASYQGAETKPTLANFTNDDNCLESNLNGLSKEDELLCHKDVHLSFDNSCLDNDEMYTKKCKSLHELKFVSLDFEPVKENAVEKRPVKEVQGEEKENYVLSKNNVQSNNDLNENLSQESFLVAKKLADHFNDISSVDSVSEDDDVKQEGIESHECEDKAGQDEYFVQNILDQSEKVKEQTIKLLELSQRAGDKDSEQSLLKIGEDLLSGGEHLYDYSEIELDFDTEYTKPLRADRQNHSDPSDCVTPRLKELHQHGRLIKEMTIDLSTNKFGGDFDERLSSFLEDPQHAPDDSILFSVPMSPATKLHRLLIESQEMIRCLEKTSAIPVGVRAKAQSMSSL